MPQPRRSRPSQPAPPGWTFPIGALCLLVAGLAAGVLVAQHLGGLSIPGCGTGSPCARAAASAWGKVPGLDWPVSIVGLAYFLGALVGWIKSRGKPGAIFMWMVRLGALVSAMYLVVAIAGSMPCPYCILAQLGNLAFAAVAEAARKRAAPGPVRTTPVIVTCAVALASAGLLLVADASARSRARAKAEDDLARSTSQLTAGARPPGDPAAGKAPDAPAPPPAPSFEGRYRLGPEVSPVRIVMFTDYQCPDCKSLESQLFRLIDENVPLSVTIKHFPLNTDCNPHAPGRRHANACWAARAAETAGIIAGADGFWRMHRWLFSRGGSFTDAELRAGVAELGLGDPAAFERTMTSGSTLQRVKSDIQEAMDHGIHFTPFIFINGVELRGWNAPDALIRAVKAVIDSAPAPATSAADRPPDAAGKMLEDWRRSPVMKIPDALLRHGIGPRDCPVTIVMFGDYTEEFTAEVDSVIRLFTRPAGPTCRYYYVHYPIDRACNPIPLPASAPQHDGACERAILAEAASLLGGSDGFEAIHDFLMRNQKTYTREGVRVAAMGAAIDADAFDEAAAQSFLKDTVADDCRAGAALGLGSVPMIFVNGKHLPRWKAGSENIIPRVIAAAEEEARASAPVPPK